MDHDEIIARIRNHVRAMGQKYPHAWEQLSMFRSMRGDKDLGYWPAWCYVPVAGAYAVVSGGGHNRVGPDNIPDVSLVAALGAWRLSQGIYVFHPEIVDALWSTEFRDKLPTEVLFSLPEFCLYFVWPSGTGLFGFDLHGFFVYLEHDAGTGEAELRIVMDCSDGVLIPQFFHLRSDSIQENLDATEQYIIEQIRKSGGDPTVYTGMNGSGDVMRRDWGRVLSMVLYLCVVNLEIRDASGKNQAPRRPVPVKTKKGFRIFPPDFATVWEVGHVTGEKILAAREETEEREIRDTEERWSPRPHLRKAHWHSFWTGPRKEGAENNRKLILKWLYPVLVGAKGGIDR